MLESLITSKTRIKLMLKFFLNSSTRAHLRGLETEFGESSNAIRLELNRFEQAGLLTSHTEANRKVFAANTRHPLFPEIQSLLHKHLGIDQLVEQVAAHLGEVESVYLAGEFAKGIESPDIDLLLAGGRIDTDYLGQLAAKASKLVKRNIRYTLVSPDEAETLLKSNGKQSLMLLWQQNH